jgi:RND superfamily putative drug exporter
MVWFAGCTVIISLLGMFMMGIDFIYGLSIAAILAVLMTMLASVTLVPAVMGYAGRKLAAKEPKRAHHRESAAFRWSRQIQKRPWIMAGLSLAFLLLLAIPMFSIRLGVADQGNDPTSLTTRRAYDLLAKGFGPGSNGPILLAGFSGSTTIDRANEFADVARADPDVALGVCPVNDAGNAAACGDPWGLQDRSTETLVHRLRSEIDRARLDTNVGSVTAIAIDAADHVAERPLWMVAVVIILSFLLLLAVFRSVLVAVKAGVMNLLSIGAAYGVIVAIFQWGWLSDVVGIGHPGPIEFWVPMLLFTVLFGLSMDYEVFLISRIREHWLAGESNQQSVAHGLSQTARVISCAALILASVFFAFLLSDSVTVKMLALGLGVSVIIDATVIRLLIVPATELLGKANW